MLLCLSNLFRGEGIVRDSYRFIGEILVNKLLFWKLALLPTFNGLGRLSIETDERRSCGISKDVALTIFCFGYELYLVFKLEFWVF